MMRSLYSAITGLDVNQKAMDVIGNNISNVNTTGFKGGRAIFQSLLSQTLTGGKAPTDNNGGINPRQVGLGGYLAAVDNIFEPGTLSTTSKTTDLAIQGDGFFVVRGEGANEMYYSRAGDFNFDRHGTLVTPAGYTVQGWMADPATGEVQDSTEVSDIVIDANYQTVQANPTSEVSMNAVLNTQADPSILEYPSLLHTANTANDVFSIFSTNGIKMDLVDNEPVRIKAHGTEITDMGFMYNDSDVNLNLEVDSSLLMYVNGNPETLTYGTDFKTMGQLRTRIEDLMEGAAGNNAVANNFVETTVGGTFDETMVSASSHGAVTDNWTIQIDPADPTRYTVTGATEGLIGTGIVGQDFSPMNPATDRPYVTIPGAAWGGSWAAGETITFDTTAAAGTDFNVDITNGTFKITRETDNGVDVQVNSFSGSPYLSVIMQSLSGTYNEISTSRSSDNMFFEDTVYAGRDFSTLSEMAASIEQAIDGNVLRASDFAVQFDEDKGRFEYQNLGTYDSATGTVSGMDLSGFMVDKAYSGSVFENNMIPSGSMSLGPSDPDNDPGFIEANDFGYSEEFYRYAKGEDELTNLYTSSGESLGLDDTAILQFNASVGGDSIPGTGTIPADGKTLDDMRKMMADYMGYPSATESQLAKYMGDIEENSGKLQVTGEDGEPNEIDWMKFEVVGGGDYAKFYDYFEYQTLQSADGGSLNTSQTIYDAQGESHVLKYEYTLEDSTNNIWKLNIEAADPNANVSFNQTGGDEILLHFNADGSFNYVTSTAGTRMADLTFNYDTANGAGTISDIEMNLGTPSQYDGIYISAEQSSVSSTEQDGYSVGQLEQTLFNPAGEIVGYYTNGNVRTLAQVSLAIFTNPQGLMKVGDTVFAETGNSGEAAIGKPQTSFRGDIASGALENSNVDLSREFVSMITTQRGYQANSRVVTTSDEMLQELLTLKR
ncbi:flagellar hook-basal body complex protein [Limisalsivibrio acetivorans]|uniref:flagellar hook-basal body complex protein n=1 Tax=Limisalsivibrio acetivorans TaxID=1304888 RepID=UPI0003B41E21|nr:flagellar hook-basal body complex protein [Limisalsivibrio acetivorans]